MGLFEIFRTPDINRGVNEYRETADAVLLDVRTPREHWNGHVPGSKNVPLQMIDKVASVVGKKETPLFVYCHSGARSRQAASALQHMGYTNVKNIGGIATYAGALKR